MFQIKVGKIYKGIKWYISHELERLEHHELIVCLEVINQNNCLVRDIGASRTNYLVIEHSKGQHSSLETSGPFPVVGPTMRHKRLFYSFKGKYQALDPLLHDRIFLRATHADFVRFSSIWVTRRVDVRPLTTLSWATNPTRQPIWSAPSTFFV